MLDNVCTAVAQNKMSELTLWFFWGPKQQMQKYAGCVTNAEIQLHQMTPRSSREQKSILPRSLGKRKLISNHLQPFTIIVVFWYTAWFVRKIYHYYSFSCRTYCIIWKEGFLFDLASLTLSDPALCQSCFRILPFNKRTWLKNWSAQNALTLPRELKGWDVT